MKGPWALLSVFAALLAAIPAQADVTLVMIRHGEKPALGFGQLDCQGLNRALALPDVLLAKFGRPDALFAPDPGVATNDFGQPYNYIRPLATIEPTAIRFGLPVNTRWGIANLAPLEDELLSPDHAGQVLFIAWEHNLVVQMARDILSRGGAGLEARGFRQHLCAERSAKRKAIFPGGPRRVGWAEQALPGPEARQPRSAPMKLRVPPACALLVCALRSCAAPESPHP